MNRRSQLVLLTAVALAVSLVPLTLAYLQLGYSADVRAGGIDENQLRDTERTLTVALEDAVVGIPGDYAWSDRQDAITAVRNELSPSLAAINRSSLDEGTVRSVTYNHSRASDWASANCPGGPNRQFGSCSEDRGIVVQERAGQTHVVAVAFDVRTVSGTGEWDLTAVLRVGRPRG